MQNNIKKLRVIAGVSQQALADKIGVKKAAISKLEKGAMQLTAIYMEKIGGVLGCSPEELMQIDSQKEGTELAIIYTIKEIISMLLGQRERTRENFIEDFGYAIEQFRQQNLLNAASVMGDLLAHVKDGTPRTPGEVMRKMRQLSPPKSA